MIKNTEEVDWSSFPVGLLDRDHFDQRFVERVRTALSISRYQDIDNYQGKTLLLAYSTREKFEEIAPRLGLIHEWTHQPRASYYGTIEFRRNDNWIILAPGNIESIVIDLENRLKRGNSHL